MRTTAGIGIILLVTLALGLASAWPAELLVPLVVDWQQHFRVDAQSATREGRTIVSGDVWNISSWSAKRIQLLVEGLDATGQPVVQRVVWLGLDLKSGTHAYFEVPMGPAAFYRVSVFAFDSSRGRWG